MRRPFEVEPAELAANLDSFVDATYADLESSFLVLPKGAGFVEYPRFQAAYECLKKATAAFQQFTPESVWSAMRADDLVFQVLRSILGMSSPEWAYLTTVDAATRVDQGTARSLDKHARMRPGYFASLGSRRNTVMRERVLAMVRVACVHITAGAAVTEEGTIHRLDQVDTAEGAASLTRAADLHIPYAMLLYERYLGRPFATQRDAVSELVGGAIESAIEERLQLAHITFRKSKRAQRVPGFDQAPDFIVPDEYAPQVVIEAKITNDDGTARDKFTRIIHLAEISRDRVLRGGVGFQVIACIDGRGFGVRREDMRRLLMSIDGKVFTLRTLDQLIPTTRLAEFAMASIEQAAHGSEARP